MAIQHNVSAIENKASGKFFILLETDPDGKMTIINPQGQVLTVPGGLFKSPFFVASDEFSRYFTSQQVDAITKKVSARKTRTTTTTRKKTPAAKAKENRLGMGSEWSSGSLVFYKHNIEPLGPKQTFRVHIDGVGTVEMSKEIFEREFNDVVISNKYWQEGSFAFTEFPEKARKYLKS